MVVKVKKVIDGDTILTTKNKYVRLAEVNTPEKGARGFKKAKETLANYVEDENLVVKVVGKSYGRDVAILRKSGEKTTINTKMKNKGYK